jgi:dienelactone hydrolase
MTFRVLTFTALVAAFVPSVVASAQTPPPAPPLPANCTSVQQSFIGTICTPPSHERHPAIILLGGSEGGDLMARFAPLFAAHGYLAVSVAYFKEPGLPQTLVDVPVETIGRALTAIESRDDIDIAHIGIFGGSKGGELALLAAATYPAITAVVADVPSPFAWMGLGDYGQPEGCSWTLGGRELPCVAGDAAAGQQIGNEFLTHQPVVLRVFYDASMQNTAAVRAAFFPLERIHGAVLCLSADDDQLWDSPVQCRMTLTYLQAHHHPYADRAIGYQNAGHTFLWATHGPSSVIMSLPLPGGATVALGGTVDGDQQAAAQAWPVIWDFLSNNL